VSVVYDGDGNRVSKTVDGVTTRYLVDDRNPTGLPQVVEELTGSSVQRVYTWGLALLADQARTQAGQWSTAYVVHDGQGSVRLLTDSAGNSTAAYSYDAFGVPLESTNAGQSQYQFLGQQQDDQLGYYMRARYYDPALGRFWTRDPIEAGSNSYGYVHNDPVNRSDPTGLCECTLSSEMAVVGLAATLATLAIALPRAVTGLAQHEPDFQLFRLANIIASSEVAAGSSTGARPEPRSQSGARAADSGVHSRIGIGAGRPGRRGFYQLRRNRRHHPHECLLHGRRHSKPHQPRSRCNPGWRASGLASLDAGDA
jgi:RHS repeat-associated protein